MSGLYRNYLLITLTSLLLVQCSPKQVVDRPLPDRDIVFQLQEYYTGGLDNRIGFINDDGSGETFLYTDSIQAAVWPIWTDDGNLLIITHPSQYIEVITKEGYRNKYRDIWAPESSYIHGMDQLIVVSDQDGKFVIKRVNLETGEVINIYQVGEFLIDDSIEGIGLGTNNIHENIIVYSRYYSEDGHLLDQELRLLNTDTNKKTVLLQFQDTYESVTRIEKPSFSPDGKWIAYTSNDGIYLIRPNGSENQRIIEHTIVNFFEWPPTVSWSPDGKWIVYHRCLLLNNYDCRNNVEDSNIYKYDLETGRETLLVEGGLNPYWRWGENTK